MIRLIALPAAFALLMSCQMTDTGGTITTRDERLVLGQTVIEDCVRSECGRLNLDSQLVDDYASIAALTHVTAFMTSYSDFSDLNDIAAMTQLRELHIGQTQVDNLSGLRNFPNLTLLHAQGLSVDDFSAIAQLRRLEELALGRGNVGDLAFVRGLRNLKNLSLENATITSLEALRNHPSLERLDLTGADMPDDISALRSLTNLKQISISDWDLSEAQRGVINQLQQSGVEVAILTPIPVC